LFSPVDESMLNDWLGKISAQTKLQPSHPLEIVLAQAANDANSKINEGLYDNFDPASNGHTNGGHRQSGNGMGSSSSSLRKPPPLLPNEMSTAAVKEYGSRGPPPPPPPRKL